MTVTVKFDIAIAQRAVAKLREKAPHLIAHAVNRAAGTARTVMSREISRDLRVQVGTVRDRINIREATTQRPEATLFASAKRIPIYDFGAKGPFPSRGKGRGVTARTQTGRYPRAFIARMASGHMGVFERSGKARLPIRELLGPSIAHVFTKLRPAAVAAARESLLKNLQSNFRFATRGT